MSAYGENSNPPPKSVPVVAIVASSPSLLAQIAHEWDKAERLIKTAELVRGEVVIASVNELRYAGRRMIDALHAAEAAQTDKTKTADAERYAGETLAFCQRALHDAVDATILFTRELVAKYESEFGQELLAEKFPPIFEIRSKLRMAEKLVILSREDRMKRAAEYDQLAMVQIPELLEHCHQLEANQDLLLSLLSAKRKTERRDGGRFWIGIGVGVVGALAAVAGIYALFAAVRYDHALSAIEQGHRTVTAPVSRDPNASKNDATLPAAK